MTWTWGVSVLLPVFYCSWYLIILNRTQCLSLLPSLPPPIRESQTAQEEWRLLGHLQEAQAQTVSLMQGRSEYGHMTLPSTLKVTQPGAHSGFYDSDLFDCCTRFQGDMRLGVMGRTFCPTYAPLLLYDLAQARVKFLAALGDSPQKCLPPGDIHWQV